MRRGKKRRTRSVMGLVGMLLACPVLGQDIPGGVDDAAVVPVDDVAVAEVDSAAEAQLEHPAEQEAAAPSPSPLALELAWALAIEAELDALLLADGQLDPAAGQDDAFVKLAGLVRRCEVFAEAMADDAARLVVLTQQARALATLMSLEPGDRPGQGVGERAEQLSDTCDQINRIEMPQASAIADYWMLAVGMVKVELGHDTPVSKQAMAEFALNQYLERYGDEMLAADYVQDVRLSLAQLLDRRGAQAEVLEQLDQVEGLPADSPRRADAQQLRDSVTRIGQPIAFEAISTQLVRWRSSDYLGKPVLVHIYAEGVASSVEMIEVINQAIADGRLRGIVVASLRVGEPVPGVAAPPWPVLPVRLEPGGVLDELGVAALPTLAWLDEAGRLASIGTTMAVLDQVDVVLSEEVDTKGASDEDQESDSIGLELKEGLADKEEEPVAQPEPEIGSDDELDTAENEIP